MNSPIDIERHLLEDKFPFSLLRGSSFLIKNFLKWFFPKQESTVYKMENSIPVQISNFLIHQPNEPSGNMALHSSDNAYKAIIN